MVDAESTSRWTDERVEQLLGNLLRVGVLLAGAVVLLGGAIYVIHHGADRSDHTEFRGEPAALRHPVGIVGAALAGSGPGVIQLGLLLLIATPVLRVILAALAFGRQRDWLYVAVALVVLAVLLYSLCSGGES